MWIERLAGSARARIVGLLRETPRTIPELATELAVSGTAVRSHVAALERDGLVEPAGLDRDTGGKPARRYRITEAAEELFPKAYVLVLRELLAVLEAREGPEGVRALMDEVAVRTVPAGKGGRTGRERLEDAVAAVGDLGGDLRVREVPDGWLLEATGCPLSGAVREQPVLCRLVEAVIARVAEAPAEECCLRNGHPSCRFLVRAPTPGRPGRERSGRSS